MNNIYKPYLAKIDMVRQETPDTKTFRLSFMDPETAESFTFKAGQFGEYSSFGDGESTFCIASSPTRKGYIECSFKAVGKVTNALKDKDVGDIIGFRGPYGNSFPIEEMYGKNLLFIGGGIGLAPLRSLIWNCLDLREKFGEITILYGARSVQDLCYKPELTEWAERPDVNFVKTVDPGGETSDWDGKVGFVPTVLKELAPSPEGAVAITCGPPIMIKFVLQNLSELGFDSTQVVTTLENRMKCGLGKCGRCNVGKTYVCIDGPVFTARELEALPVDF
ncbi:MAG: heterodisulfide reductase subunit F [Ignavibacteria bacterium]|jgi:NAD(P)H-flavin reductase|nr:heterodisulfide reductase subunit F [Ignavibacteria bacterium]MCU7503490.1 heterodisulfide reductase subunit F [Ignavibacteria bacterium]MCU7516178.1 heterodisulfide reductase subunit F [Ignavibacteria bacterium]